MRPHIGYLEDDRLQHELQAAIADRPLTATSQKSSSATSGSIVSLGDLRSVQGTSVRIDGPDKGAPRLIYFLSPWCETYLKDSRPQMAHACRQTRDALTRLAVTRKAQVIGIASGLSTDTDGVRRYLGRTGFNVPIVFDGDGQLFRRFDVRSFPTVIQLDADGRSAGRLTPHQMEMLANHPPV
ncbi:MAG: TlpA disulfide reductase family protein [Sphingomonas sp.]